ncbi:hypothetical protein HanRHA438_Chr08g0355331 [Helianthus annuus]|nr:hypothetical protein HanRHA438_Chr08g0355331 [Helianthus annuus]
MRSSDFLMISDAFVRFSVKNFFSDFLIISSEMSSDLSENISNSVKKNFFQIF